MNRTYLKIVEAIGNNELDEMIRLVDETNFDVDAEEIVQDAGKEGEVHYCWPLLTAAIYAGAETPIIDWLIKRGAKKYDTALWAAVRNGHVDRVRWMIQLGANVNMKTFGLDPDEGFSLLGSFFGAPSREPRKTCRGAAGTSRGWSRCKCRRH